MTYELEAVDLPRLAGRKLSWAARLLERGPLRAPVLTKLMRDGGMIRFRERRLAEPPTMTPGLPHPADLPEALSDAQLDALARPETPAQPTLADFAGAYRQGTTTPAEVAERFVAALEASGALEPPLCAFIASDRDDLFAQAKASTERHQRGEPLGPLDGVPIAIKDEVDQTPYPTTVGTTFLGEAPATEDATVVARLRAAGALLVGKTNMHEIGINPNGLNVHYGVARNPYDRSRDTGGSSSGSAAATAAGLCAAALGADGGGSIRIPAALCGLVGLKPTFGRLSERGAAPLCWSVAHLGPLSTTAADAALLYAIMAGPDPADPNTAAQPPVSLADFERGDLSDLRLGVYEPWFEHADGEVVAACRRMLEALAGRGARVVEVDIEELEEMRIAHAITILGEMATSMADHPEHIREFGAGVRVNLAVGRALGARDYLHAQRMRTRAIGIMNRVFEKADLVVTPATGIAAPPIPDHPLPRGWSDLTTVTELMRYVFPGNLTGVPAISFPAGYTEAGLPIGMQAMAAGWREDLLLRVARAAEHHVERRAPATVYSLLE